MGTPGKASHNEPPDAVHPHSMMSSTEVDALVYSYLLESGYNHTSFSLLHEAALSRASASTSTSQPNGRKHSRAESEDSILGLTVPPGHLVRILQKGLLYLEAEARYRGDPLDPPPRLVGYTIPNALPLPPLPKTQPASSATPPPPTPGPSTIVDPHPPTETLTNGTTPSVPPPTNNVTSTIATNSKPTVASKEKDKGKGKEVVPPPAASSSSSAAPPPAPTTVTSGKRKGRAGSDRDDPSGASDGKRPRIVSGDKKRKGSAQVPNASANAASELSAPPPPPPPAPTPAVTKDIERVMAQQETEDSSMEMSSENHSPMSTDVVENDRPPSPPPAEEEAPSTTSKEPEPTAMITEEPRPELPPLPSSPGTTAPSTLPETTAPPAIPAPSEPPSSNHVATPTLPSPELPTALPTSHFPPSTTTNPIAAAASEPSTPSLPTTVDIERRASLPESSIVKLTSDELHRIKKEEGESLGLGLKMAVEEAEGDKEEGELDVEEGELQKEEENGHAEEAVVKPGDADGDVEMAPATEEEGMPGPRLIDGADRRVTKLKGHTVAKVQPCSWNPKVPELLATGGGDSTCRIWDVPVSGSKAPSVIKDSIVCKHSSAQRRADVAAVAWDPTGSLLATGSEDGIARIWTPSGDLHLVLSMHQRTIFSLKWNSVGTMLLTGSLDNTVCLWDLSSGRVKQQWSSHSDSVLDVDWNDDSTFASASMDKTIHLFATTRVSPINRFKGHRDEVNVVKFSPCGTLLASCSDDKTVRVWSLRNITGFSLGARVTIKDEGRVIDDKEHQGVLVLEGHDSDVHTVAWGPWEKDQTGPRLLASASFDTTTRLWDADSGACLYTFAGHTEYVYSLAFNPGLGNLLATGSNDGKMCIWDVKERKLVLEYSNTNGSTGKPAPIYELAWHPSGTHLAICGQTEDVACVAFEP